MCVCECCIMCSISKIEDKPRTQENKKECFSQFSNEDKFINNFFHPTCYKLTNLLASSLLLFTVTVFPQLFFCVS